MVTPINCHFFQIKWGHKMRAGDIFIMAAIDKNIPWLYVFKGSASIFNNEPLVYSAAPLSLTAIRPSSLTILSDTSSPLGVCFASPVRKGMIFNLQITEGQLKLINPRLLSNSSNNNGYGAIQMSSFSSNKRNYICLLYTSPSPRD